MSAAIAVLMLGVVLGAISLWSIVATMAAMSFNRENKRLRDMLRKDGELCCGGHDD